MSRLARFAAIQGHSMLTVSAARRRLPSPVGLPLAGFLRRAQRGLPCEVQHDPLEINAAAFRDGDKAALLIAIDTLIAGPDLTAAADALAQECFGPGTVALVAASHTHFAPATDRTRPMLGEIAPAYVAAVHAALRQVIVGLRAAQTGPSVGLASCASLRCPQLDDDLPQRGMHCCDIGRRDFSQHRPRPIRGGSKMGVRGGDEGDCARTEAFLR